MVAFQKVPRGVQKLTLKLKKPPEEKTEEVFSVGGALPAAEKHEGAQPELVERATPDADKFAKTVAQDVENRVKEFGVEGRVRDLGDNVRLIAVFEGANIEVTIKKLRGSSEHGLYSLE